MRIALALLVLTLAASCVAPPASRPGPPTVARAPVDRPAPAPSASALPADWRDWPITPGDWDFRRYNGRSGATFGTPGMDDAKFVISCGDGRSLRLTRPGGEPLPYTVRTSTASRVLKTTAIATPPAGAEATLAASDPLLDAIAFSRGRWTIEQPGAAPLVLPADAEVARVVEDCRG